MRIVLPGALPDPAQARELLPHLVKTAPALTAWLERSRASRIVADPVRTYCTAWEYWQLQQAGFTPEPGQRDSAGLGPLLAPPDPSAPDEPVWLVELTHIAPSRDGAVLICASDLDISDDHSRALFDSALPLFADSGFALRPYSSTHWQIGLPHDYTPLCPSPQLVSITSVNDWWQQDTAGRPWRRLANELQMLWFDHPVNHERYEQQLMPINHVWLFGGGRRTQLHTASECGASGMHPDTRLLQPMLAQDWSGWLQAWASLEAELFPSLDRHSQLVLIGRDRIITYTTDTWFWKRWLPGTREAWKTWWSFQN